MVPQVDHAFRPRVGSMLALLAVPLVLGAGGLMGACGLSSPPATPAPTLEAEAASALPAQRATGAANPARPPWPNMATAAWGQRVLEDKLATLDPGPPGEASGGAVLDALHALEQGSEQRALARAIAWYRAAPRDADRSTACALAAAALVLDPTVEGYKERLTDAAGLAAYAGTLDASDPVGQAARAMVVGASGAVAQARRLVEVVETTPKLGPEPRLFLGLTRKLIGEHSDVTIAHFQEALAARPASARARAALAELWIELGLMGEARTALATPATAPAAETAWLLALQGRALLLEGRAADAVPALRAADPRLAEGRRGDVLYWLGLALAQSGAAVGDVEAIAASLGARPGFTKEASVLQGLMALRAGDPGRARALLEPLMRGPPSLPVDSDAAWLLAETCGALGDVKCLDGAGARALGTDGDISRLHRVRAAAGEAGKLAVDGLAAQREAQREAHRASPFDAALAKKVGEPLVSGGPAAAARVRGARRALARKGGSIVDTALGPVAADPACRVCRALRAAAASGTDAATRALAALAGRGPPLAEADLVLVAHALGAAPTPEARRALDALARDPRPEVKRAVERSRADHADPEARRRRDSTQGGSPPPQGADAHDGPGMHGSHRDHHPPPSPSPTPLPGPRRDRP